MLDYQHSFRHSDTHSHTHTSGERVAKPEADNVDFLKYGALSCNHDNIGLAILQGTVQVE